MPPQLREGRIADRVAWEHGDECGLQPEERE